MGEVGLTLLQPHEGSEGTQAGQDERAPTHRKSVFVEGT